MTVQMALLGITLSQNKTQMQPVKLDIFFKRKKLNCVHTYIHVYNYKCISQGLLVVVVLGIRLNQKHTSGQTEVYADK